MDNWNIYWNKHAEDLINADLNSIIEGDHYYFLLKKLFMKTDLSKNRNTCIRILEAGCGSGLRTLALIKDFKNLSFDVTFLDISKIALELIDSLVKRSNLENNAKFTYIQGNLLNIPIADNQFDLVWNEGVMEHFSGIERVQTFYEIYRVCKSGGYYIVIVPNLLNLPLIVRNWLLKRVGKWEYGYQREFTIFELSSRMKKAGFKIVAKSGVDSLFLARRVLSRLFTRQNKKTNTAIGSERSAVYIASKQNFEPFHKKIKKLEWILEHKLKIGQITGREIGICGQKLEVS